MDGMDEVSSSYTDASWPEWGVHHVWEDATILERRRTAKGTCVEMIRRPQWGIACYMNGEIQSGEVDESVYHEALVHPAMVHTSSPPRRVLILGGGEGATAREALKWPSVERVDMYEWDEEVTSLFRDRFPQWAKGAWEDHRLVLHHEDVFEAFREGIYPPVPYDVILIDLFEPVSDQEGQMWTLFTRLASNWLAEGGSMAMYSGIRNHFRDIHPAEEWLHEERISTYAEQHHLQIPNILAHREVYSYKVFLPSFLGEAMFLLVAPSPPPSPSPVNPFSGVPSHLTPEIWKAYHTWNRYPLRAETEGVFHGV